MTAHTAFLPLPPPLPPLRFSKWHLGLFPTPRVPASSGPQMASHHPIRPSSKLQSRPVPRESRRLQKGKWQEVPLDRDRRFYWSRSVGGVYFLPPASGITMSPNRYGQRKAASTLAGWLAAAEPPHRRACSEPAWLASPSTETHQKHAYEPPGSFFTRYSDFCKIRFTVIQPAIPSKYLLSHRQEEKKVCKFTLISLDETILTHHDRRPFFLSQTNHEM